MKRVTADFETRSECDLKKAGAYKYSLHPTTRPTCLAFKERGKDKVYLLKFHEINKPWKELHPGIRYLWKLYIDNGYLFTAQNAFFERCIYENILVKRYGWPAIPAKRWRCTAAKAAACALPRNLEGAGDAMQLTTQKDKRGYAAMMKTCKPTAQYNAWLKACAEVKAGKRVGARKQELAKSPAPPVFLSPEAAPDVWATLYHYCKVDVITEELLDEALPDLIPFEQEVWHLNQTLNWRGLRVDIPTVRKIVGVMATESKNKLKELDKLTMGLVTKAGARQSILDFLALDGVILPDIRAKTVDDVLKAGKLSPDMRRLLEIRKALSKTSTRKYQAFLDRAGDDERIRDIVLYHGASTGRDSGTGINAYNFPRGLIRVDKRRPYAAVENVIECDEDMLRLLYGDTLPIVFSAILRNMLIPSEGHELFVADFAKIEVAILWWLAGNEPGLKILRAGKDPYIYQAAANLNKTYEEVQRAEKANEPWAVDARQLGKAQILGCVAEGTSVLTQDGYKPIETITIRDKLWDGETWVNHGGLVATGSKIVIQIARSGIELTPDHWVLSKKGWFTAVETDIDGVTPLPESAYTIKDAKLFLKNSITARNAVSVCAAYVELKKNFALISFGEGLTYSVLDALNLLTDRKAALPVNTRISLLIQNLESVGRYVSTISRNGAWTPAINSTNGTAVAVFDYPLNQLEVFWNTLLHCAGLTNGGSRWTELITMGTMSPETYELLISQQIIKTVATFDVQNAGPRNRFQAAGEIIHNCGFRMSAKRFKESAYDMYRLKLTGKQSVEAVKNYRTLNSAVPEMWEAIEEAAVEALETGKAVRTCKCVFKCEKGFLWITLPSGRKLAYRSPTIVWRTITYTTYEEDEKGREYEVQKTSKPKKTVQFMGLDKSKKKLAPEITHGGVLTENIVQAIARDVMMGAELRLEDAGYKLLLSVYDEALTEKKKGVGSLEEFKRLMCKRPPWADSKLPLDANAWTGPRYRK